MFATNSENIAFSELLKYFHLTEYSKHGGIFFNQLMQAGLFGTVCHKINTIKLLMIDRLT